MILKNLITIVRVKKFNMKSNKESSRAEITVKAIERDKLFHPRFYITQQK